MDTFIVVMRLIRFPVGIIASILLLAFWIALFPLEVVLMIIMLPFVVIFKADTAAEAFDGFPRSLLRIPDDLSTVWSWVFVE
jgi:hypothetical protein